jgi:tape measure domain-containing protein
VASNETKLQIVVDAQNNTNSTFAKVGSNLDAVTKSTANLRAGMMAVGTAGTVAFTGLSLLTSTAVKTAASFEQSQIAFTTLLGSADKAQDTLQNLFHFAATTPFEIPQLLTASKQLLAYGESADDLIPTLKMLGDLSAGVGMDKLPQLILAFGQVKAATKLTGMELRQFSEAGIPLLGTLADQFGVTAAVMTKMISKGKVSFGDVQTALQSLTAEGGRFHDGMASQATSLIGLWSNFHDQITLTSAAIGTQLLPYLKPLVEQLISLTQAVGNFVREHPQLTAGLLIIALAFTAILAVLLPIAIALPGLVILFTGLGTALAFVTAMSFPVLLAVAAIIAILAVLAASGMTTKEAWQDAWLGIQLIAAEVANSVIGIVQGMINFIIDGVNSAISAMNRVIALAQKIPGIGKSISKISAIPQVSLGGFDSDTIVANDLAGRSNPVSTPNNTVNLFGNFLSENVAEQIGDLIMGKLKLSNQL